MPTVRALSVQRTFEYRLVALREKKGTVRCVAVQYTVLYMSRTSQAPSRLELLLGGQGRPSLVLHLKSTATHHHR